MGAQRIGAAAGTAVVVGTLHVATRPGCPYDPATLLLACTPGWRKCRSWLGESSWT
jgi:hypothetical protein